MPSSITSGQVDADSPLDTALMGAIKDELDDAVDFMLPNMPLGSSVINALHGSGAGENIFYDCSNVFKLAAPPTGMRWIIRVHASVYNVTGIDRSFTFTMYHANTGASLATTTFDVPDTGGGYDAVNNSFNYTDAVYGYCRLKKVDATAGTVIWKNAAVDARLAAI